MSKLDRNSLFIIFALYLLINTYTVCSKSVGLQQANRVLHRRDIEPPDRSPSSENTESSIENTESTTNESEINNDPFDARVEFDCQSREPLYAIRDSVNKQYTRSPYIINLEPSTVVAGETVQVSITTVGGHLFKGMMLQIITSNGSSEGLGKFIASADINLQNCNHDDDTAILESPAGRDTLHLEWTPTSDVYGDIIARGTFVEDYDTYWADETSNVIIVDMEVESVTNDDVGKTPAPTGNTVVDDDASDTGVIWTDDLDRNDLIDAEKIDTATNFVDTRHGNNVQDTDVSRSESTQKPTSYSPMSSAFPYGFTPPVTAEIIGSLLKSIGGAGGSGLGSMMNLMSGLGGGGGGLLSSLLGGGRKTAPVAVPPPPTGGAVIPVRNAGNEPSLADLLGVDPSTVVDRSPAAAAVPAAQPSGGGLGSLLGNIGTISTLANMFKPKPKASTNPFASMGGGGFGGGTQAQMPPTGIMQELQRQQMQIQALQQQLKQTNPNLGFGNFPTNQQFGMPGQPQIGVGGTGLFGQTNPSRINQNMGFGQQTRQTVGFPQTGNLFGRQTNQGFQQTGAFTNPSSFQQNTNGFGQNQGMQSTTMQQGGNDPVLQELIRQNQLLMQQNQQLRTGGMSNNNQMMNTGIPNNGQGMNNNGFGQNTGINNNIGGTPNANFGQNNGMNNGMNNNLGSGTGGNFGQNQGTNGNNQGIFGQNQNMGINGQNPNMGMNGQQNNGLGGQNTAGNPGQQGMGTNGFGQNTGSTMGGMMGNTGQQGMGANGFGQNTGSTIGGMNGFGQNSNSLNNNGGPGFNQNGGMNSGNNMNGNANNNMNNNMNNNGFGGNSNMNGGFGGMNQNPGPGTGSSAIGQFGGGGGGGSQLSSMFGSGGNNPLGGLLGNGGPGQGAGGGAGGMQSLLGNMDPSALQGMLGQMGGGGGAGMSSLLQNVDVGAVQNMMQGEQGASLMNSLQGLMSSDDGGGLMDAVNGLMSGDPNAMGSIQSIMSGDNGGNIMDLANQAQSLMSQSGIDPTQLLAMAG